MRLWWKNRNLEASSRSQILCVRFQFRRCSDPFVPFRNLVATFRDLFAKFDDTTWPSVNSPQTGVLIKSGAKGLLRVDA